MTSAEAMREAAAKVAEGITRKGVSWDDIKTANGYMIRASGLAVARAIRSIPIPPAEGDRDVAEQNRARALLAFGNEANEIIHEAIFRKNGGCQTNGILAAEIAFALASARLAGAEERQKQIVAWLRSDENSGPFGMARDIADAIERGDYTGGGS